MPTSKVNLPTVTSPAAPLTILVDDSAPPRQSSYTVHLLSPDGHDLASVTAQRRSIDQTAADRCVISRLPATSASAKRAFFLDGDSVLRYLDPDGGSGVVRNLGGSSDTEVAFAVTPDESRIAVARIQALRATHTYHEELTVQSLDGGMSTPLFSQDIPAGFAAQNQISWPVAWRQGLLVVADGLPLPQAGCHDAALASAYDLVDAATGTMRVHFCSMPADAQPSGAPVTGGVFCVGHDTSAHPVMEVDVIESWTGQSKVFARSLCGHAGLLSPDESMVASAELAPSGQTCGPGDGHVHLVSASGGDTSSQVTGTPLAWMDTTHLLCQTDGALLILDVASSSLTKVSVAGGVEGLLPPTLG